VHLARQEQEEFTHTHTHAHTYTYTHTHTHTHIAATRAAVAWQGCWCRCWPSCQLKPSANSSASVLGVLVFLSEVCNARAHTHTHTHTHTHIHIHKSRSRRVFVCRGEGGSCRMPSRISIPHHAQWLRISIPGDSSRCVCVCLCLCVCRRNLSSSLFGSC
jgi:hypothetical protein